MLALITLLEFNKLGESASLFKPKIQESEWDQNSLKFEYYIILRGIVLKNDKCCTSWK